MEFDKGFRTTEDLGLVVETICFLVLRVSDMEVPEGLGGEGESGPW